VVPVYALTGGRTRSTGGSQLPLETLVTVSSRGAYAGDLQLEYSETIRLAARPVSVVEISALLHVPAGVARVIVSDLVAAGFLEIHLPPTGGDGPPPAVLERLLEGLRAR
jgi:hypothetical protein